MVWLRCVFCDKEFLTRPSWARYGRKYCSEPCQRLGMRKGKNILCTWCGREVYKPLRQIKETSSGNFFCSKKCNLAWLTSVHREEKHPNWRTGQSSYRNILKRRNIIQQCTMCKTTNVEVLAVHHFDHNRDNNEISNLKWLCHNCHFLVHHYVAEEQRLQTIIKKVHAK